MRGAWRVERGAWRVVCSAWRVVSALVSESSSSDSSPGRGHRVMFLGETLYFHIASLQPGVQIGTGEFNDGVTAAID